MNVKSWSPEEREEFEAACVEAWRSSDRQGERTEAFIDALRDARQAHRFWAGDVLEEALRTGASSILKNWSKRQRILVTFEGQVVSRPRMVGRRRDDGEGRGYTEQALLDSFTLDELRSKRTEYLTQIKAYRQNIAVLDELIALCEATGCATPAEAARSLGTTVDAWLKQAAA